MGGEQGSDPQDGAVLEQRRHQCWANLLQAPNSNSFSVSPPSSLFTPSKVAKPWSGCFQGAWWRVYVGIGDYSGPFHLDVRGGEINRAGRWRREKVALPSSSESGFHSTYQKFKQSSFSPQRAEEPLLGMLVLVLDCSKKVSGNSKCLSWFPRIWKTISVMWNNW